MEVGVRGRFPKMPRRMTLSFAFSVTERAIVEDTARRQFGDREMKYSGSSVRKLQTVSAANLWIWRWDQPDRRQAGRGDHARPEVWA